MLIIGIVLFYQAYRLPNEHNSPIADADMMLSLLGQMSPGIVGMEVKVESSPITPSVGLAHFGSGAVDGPSIETLSIRKVGLWIRITEVEGKEVPHVTTIYSPILQLIVTGSEGKVHKIQTLSVDGKDPISAALSAPGPIMPFSLPGLEPVGPVEGRKDDENIHPHHRHHGHWHKHKKLGFFARIAQFFGLRSANSGWRRRSGDKKGCRGHREHGHFGNGTEENDIDMSNRRAKYGHRHHHHHDEQHQTPESYRTMTENPFSGVMEYNEEPIDADEIEVESEGSKTDHGHSGHGTRKGHTHRQHRYKNRKHGRCGGFFHRMAIGIRCGLALFASVVLHPITLMTLSSITAFGVLFHFIRRVILNRRGGSIQLREEETAEVLFDGDVKEKIPILEEVVVEENITGNEASM